MENIETIYVYYLIDNNGDCAFCNTSETDFVESARYYFKTEIHEKAEKFKTDIMTIGEFIEDIEKLSILKKESQKLKSYSDVRDFGKKFNMTAKIKYIDLD